MSEVKKTDHSADVLASIKSQVPTVLGVDKYLEHNLIIKNLKKSPKAMIESKGNRERNKIRLTHYQTQMPWIREVTVKIKTRVGQQREEDPNGASGSAQPPSKDDDQSSKKPWESDASALQINFQTLTQLDWQITDTKMLLKGCDKERKIALSISKLKAARYLDFGLKELVPSLWVESEREYDISAVYGITHWWFRRKEFYINKHSEPSDREAEYIRAWRLGSGQRMTREEAKTSSLRSRKDYRSGGSFEVYKALLEENRDIATG
ncbi:hypothetical protein Tco_0475538 [Tanacetum coccineum]|uniref:Uncharacterized protein n=1 Tax=Tanacetum coccineum TaxID=301880 RepID=A0ABQ5BG94_9ASTR